MADYYALTKAPLPISLHGSDSEYSIRTLTERERIAIEDYFFGKGVKVAVDPATTAVIVPQGQTANAEMEDLAILVEFALAVLTVSGFQPVAIVATFNASSCTNALQRSYPESSDPPKFAKKVVKSAGSRWVRLFFSARHRSKDRLHVT